MLAVAGGKGGCGKTTTVACLARALAAVGHDPVAVDADLDMPDLALVAGAPTSPGLDALGREPLAELLHPAVELPGVRVLPAGSASVDALAGLDALRERAPPVLLDTAAGASPPVARALALADRALLVTTPTRRCLTDTAKTAAVARELDTPVLGAVVTESPGDCDPEPLLGCPTLGHVPPSEAPLTDDRVRDRYRQLSAVVTDG